MLDNESKQKLLEVFPPRWKLVGHHVTYKFGASDKDPLPPAGKYQVVGYNYIAEKRPNGSGLEALVVAIDGNTTREDGSVYHITWSHGPAFRPKDSNDLLKRSGWTTLEEPIDINLEPAFIPFQ